MHPSSSQFHRFGRKVACLVILSAWTTVSATAALRVPTKADDSKLGDMRYDHINDGAGMVQPVTVSVRISDGDGKNFVDTRDSKAEGVPKLIDKRSDGVRLISYEMVKQALIRPAKSKVTVFMQIKIPEFSELNGGWGETQKGLGAFYGLEMKTFSNLTPGDTIQYKLGGAPPTPDCPTTDWKPTTFDQVIDIPLEKGICYFKITLASGTFGVSGVDPGPLKVSARFKSARLCDASGGPVAALNSGSDLWVLSHGKIDSEKSFRSMNKAVAERVGDSKVVTLDWASGATGSFLDLSNGRYFVNLGKNLGRLLKKSLPPAQVSWVGHSWGTYVGCETARALGRVNRFTALDPAATASGGYDVGRINFGRFSNIATGVKGGSSLNGFFGSAALANTCDFSIRLYSENAPISSLESWGFYHSLPRAWFIRTMVNTSNPYWTFFRGILLRNELRPAMPWGKYSKIEGFNIEDQGQTRNRSGNIYFLSHNFLLYESSEGVLKEARANKNTDGTTGWNYINHPVE